VGDDFAHALAVDAWGNVFVTGESVGPGTGADYATLKYDTRGRLIWVSRYDGPGNASDVATDVAVDASGSVYVTGESRGSALIDDFGTVKYDALGNEQWVARYDDAGGSFNLPTALAVGASGDVCVTGRTTDLGFSRITTVKYTQAAVGGLPEQAR